MGIFDMFIPSQPAQQAAPAQPAQQQQPATPGNIPDPQVVDQQTAQTPANGQVPAQSASESKTTDSPLDQFADLWKNEPNTDANSGAANQAAPQLTQENLQQVMSKVDFAKSISPEQMQAVAAGGEGATAALAQMLNSVAQQTMVQSTLVNNKLMEQAIAKTKADTMASMPDLVRQHAASSHLKDTDPLFSNPAIQPVIQATQQQLLQKYPNATPQELTSMTQNFIRAMGETFNPQAPAASSPNETDWSTFLE